MDNAAVKLESIVKSFPGVLALDEVDLELRAGEIHALVGENGAGKSTLVKILTGIYRADRGEIYVRGKPVRIESPADAERLGILCIHQEPALVTTFDIAGNIFLGQETTSRLGLVQTRKMRDDARAVLERLGLDLDPSTSVADLSIGEQQMVGICRALTRSPAVFILDEPTAPLAQAEVSHLFALLRQLRQEGIAILYISHRMEEVFELADRITVMRDGRRVSTVPIGGTSSQQIVQLMLGRSLDGFYPKEPVQQSAELLRAEHVSSGTQVRDVSLSIHAGEVVGIYGLIGAGQAELALTLVGAREMTSGSLWMEGKPIRASSPAEALRHGIALVPRERRVDGLVQRMTVKENITLAALRRWTLAGFIRFAAERRAAQEQVDALSIRTPGLGQEVRHLSGGNQQKVVVGKWLAQGSRVIICDEPTRGVDVGAKVEVYVILNSLLQAGTGILLISSELPEVLSLSDRILVLFQGEVVLDKPAHEVTADQVLSHALLGRAAAFAEETRPGSDETAKPERSDD